MEKEGSELSKNSVENELQEELKVVKKQLNNMRDQLDRMIFFRNIIVLSITSIITVAIIQRTGGYPWGSDTYGHLYKGNILYDSLKGGKLFLNYNESWYNGLQPFRYWAPIPYYILALINLITNNIIITYNIYIFFIFFIGGLGWLCWGNYIRRQRLGLILAILWFFVPNNLRILFSEGNIPYTVVNSLIPYIFLYYYKSIKEKELLNYIMLVLFMALTTLSHAMLSAMTGLSLFIFAFIDSVVNKRYMKNLISLLYAFSGIMTTSFWLYPALKGGIMSIDKAAVAEVMKDLTYPLSMSLNPVLRFTKIEIYYYGLAFAVVALFGLLLSTKNERASFLSALVILIGTTKIPLPLLQKLPMNQLFWMSRFTSISMAMIIMALILWKTLRRTILALLISIMIIDSACSFSVLGFNGQFPFELSKILDNASKIATQRIGVLDLSQFGSFPSYYIPYNSVGGTTDQVYGWAWQGAGTAPNIVAINTALERGYYDFMFDRSLELGADTLVIKKSLIADFYEMERAASIVGYERYEEGREAIIYKYPNVNRFGTRVNYEGIAIGQFSNNLIYIFPTLQEDYRSYFDEYTYEELENKKVVFLSGFKYRNKKRAEELALKLSRKGVRLVIDVTGLREDFLGITSEPITLRDNYQEMYYKKERVYTKPFPKENKEWRSYFLGGIRNSESYVITNNRLINYIGNIDNDNLVFIGLNLPYYTFLTKDGDAIRILEDSLNLKSYALPKREIQEIDFKREEDVITISAKSPYVKVPIAALDAFEKIKGNYEVSDNLIYMTTSELQIKITYPYLRAGTITSVIFIGLILIFSMSIRIHSRGLI